MMPRHPSVPNLISTATATPFPSFDNPSGDRSACFCGALAQVRLGLQPGGGEVVFEHLTDHFGETDLRTPAQLCPGFARITSQVWDFRRAEVRLIHLNMVLPVEADQPEGELRQLPDAPLYAGGDHVVVRLVLLQHHPHCLDVVLRVAPVALGIEIAEPEF